MANCQLTDTFGVQFSEALKTNRYLEKFNFSGNEMTSLTLAAFARTLKGHPGRGKEGLKEISFAKNCLNDEGGVKLGE